MSNKLYIHSRRLLVVLALSSFTCSFAREFQKMDPPKVLSYFPSHCYLKASEVSEIRLHFSHPMETECTEEAFSLKTNTTPLPGTFRWEERDRTLIFSPLAPLKDKQTYTLSVSSTAEDRWGNSLLEEFNHVFHTKEEIAPPNVLTFYPDSGAKITHSRHPIGVTFSEPMDRESILRSFSLTPSLPGVFSFGANSDSFVWSPMVPYRQGETYQVTIRKDACDSSGNCLVEEFRFSFQMIQTETKILSVVCSSNGTVLLPTTPGTYVNPSLRIEKNEAFRIRFTTPVDPETRDAILTIHPATAYRMDWNTTGDEVLLYFPEPLVWNAVYELQILSSLYRFRVNGPLSIPPEVRRILYLPDTTTEPTAYEELLFCHNYTFPDSAFAAFDVYISLVPGASIVTSSFLSSFSIETGNGCLDLRLLRVEENPNSPPPKPYPPIQEGDMPLNVQVFRVHCRITSVFSSGTVTITLRKELQDNLGNHLSQPYTLIVNKQ
ncbi:MAG: Ig-like domain-containing protein [Spirochaetes bacterium]|nr:Ig-like domain-containing protein [Spirochaetota bacterium]